MCLGTVSAFPTKTDTKTKSEHTSRLFVVSEIAEAPQAAVTQMHRALGV